MIRPVPFSPELFPVDADESPAPLNTESSPVPASVDLGAFLFGEDQDAEPYADEDLIPARMLNEFTYCPRLAYLEWVQGEFADNLDTKQGTFAHRIVDQPSSRHVPAADEWGDADDEDPKNADPIKTRSLTLSAPREGLLAKLDILQLEGSVATPVEYKKGSIPDNPEQAWEPERVQLCAQGLILRENGYTCEQGELYYAASRHRVVVPFDDALVMRTRELVKRLREMAQAEHIPPPLIDSPKCPRCSLVGICLPDETNLLRRDEIVQLETTSDPLTARLRPNTATPVVRQLLPSKDDALPLYVKEQGAVVGKDGDRLTIRHREAKLMSVPLIDISQVSVFGNVQMSAQVLREIVNRGIPICHFSYGGWFHAMTIGHDHKNVELRMAQFATAADPVKSLALAKGFITAKIKNSRTILRRHANEKHQRDLDQLAEWIQKAERAESAESLLGLEGMAAKIYFAGFARILKGDHAFDFNGRNRRPPRDPINALLSFVYALLAKELTIAVRSVGLDPLLGFFHRPRYGRPSLALDLAEEFRPIIADSTVLMLVNNGEVAISSFLARAGSVALTEPARKAVIAAFERRLEQEITHPIFGYKISYRRVLQVQARLLSRVVLGELTEYPGFCTR
ncbi:MAG: CRISPR-associated endonuclease Cas1 [Planctomycetales bacterium]|nr:CRISPR-associated endonuclease Cas1 [Planctomycetales bacterium]